MLEIFYLIAGPKLPKTLIGASLLPSPGGQGVILMGGYHLTGYQSSIYTLICDQLGCKWSKMEQQLKIPRNFLVAMLIPDTLTHCSKDIYIPYPIQKSEKRIFPFPFFEWDMLKDIISEF
jgi:hypothetical protein